MIFTCLVVVELRVPPSRVVLHPVGLQPREPLVDFHFYTSEIFYKFYVREAAKKLNGSAIKATHSRKENSFF